MKVVVTTGAISCAKLLSNRHHQQTNTQLLQAGCPSCHPTNGVEALEGILSQKLSTQNNHQLFRDRNWSSICTRTRKEGKHGQTHSCQSIARNSLWTWSSRAGPLLEVVQHRDLHHQLLLLPLVKTTYTHSTIITVIFVCLFVCLVFNGTFSTNRLYRAITVG